MRKGHAHSLSFERALTFTLVAVGAAALVTGCGSISVVSDGGSGAGGHIDVTTGSGGATGDGGHTGAGGSGAGGKVGAGGATGSGGMTAGTGGAGMGGGTSVGGKTGTVDAGVDRGCICPDVVAPVCGSDGMTYNNACLAGCAGVTVAHTGACIVACTAVRGCCSTDDDCNNNQECAGVTCGADGRASGVCKARPAQLRRCWTDADCAGQNNNTTCTGAVVCPCNTVCARADLAGTCN